MAIHISESLGLEIRPEHHGNHPSTGELWFQESALFNFCDPRRGIGGEYRIGIHPERGTGHLYAWTQVGGAFADKRFEEDLELPEGDVNNTRLGDVAITTLDPFKTYRIEVDRADVKLDVTWTAFMPPVQMSFNAGGATVAAGHYNAVGRATGKIVHDGDEHTVDGDGFMDHSWGVRERHLPGSRWVLAIFDPEHFVMALPLYTDKGKVMAGYVAWDGMVRRLVDDFEINMAMRDDWITPAGCDARLFDEDGRGFRVSGCTVGPASIHPFVRGKMYTHALAEFELGGRIGRGLLESSAPEGIADLPSQITALGLNPDGIWVSKDPDVALSRSGSQVSG